MGRGTRHLKVKADGELLFESDAGGEREYLFTSFGNAPPNAGDLAPFGPGNGRTIEVEAVAEDRLLAGPLLST